VRGFPTVLACLALLCAACAAAPSPDHEPVASTGAALAAGQEVTVGNRGLDPLAQDGPRIVISGLWTDLAEVFCVKAGAAHLLQKLMPGPGVVLYVVPRVAAGQGTIVVSTSPFGPVLGVLAVYAPSSAGWHLEASLAPPASVSVADVFGTPVVTTARAF